MAKDKKTASEPSTASLDDANTSAKSEEPSTSGSPVQVATSHTEEVRVADPVSLSVIASPDVPTSWLDLVPKNIRQQLTLMPPVDTEEFEAAATQLAPVPQEAFKGFVAKMNPVKLGMVVSNEQFKVFDARIYHGTGDDDNRPAAASPGSFYTSDNRVLAIWDKSQANLNRVPQQFVGAVVGLQETRTWWKPRNPPPDWQPPIGVEPNSKAPFCRSADRKRGDKFGDCDACPHRPYANGKMDHYGCANDVRLYFVLRDFSGFYSIVLKGSSLRVGITPLKKRIGALATPWDMWFEFGLAEERNDQGRWFSLTTAVHSTAEAPTGLATTPAERIVLGVLARQIMNEVYRPELQRLYDHTRPVGARGAPSTANVDALAANAEAAAKPDYSSNNL